MKSTLNLKKPNNDGLSLIYLKAYFKNEGCKFVYSTGEKITPKDWDYVNKTPNNLNGRTKEAENHRTIKRQLDRYSNFFSDTIQAYKLANRDIIIADFKDNFDAEFKRTKSISSKYPILLILFPFHESYQN